MSDTGTLVVRVFTSQAQLPIEDATVIVTRRDPEGRLELLNLQVTDSSGLIQPIELQTPPPGDSTAPLPDGSTEQPCALCSVWAEHPGYAMLQVEGVQVFPGVQTLQKMRLLPLSQGESSLQQRTVRDIASQLL